MKGTFSLKGTTFVYVLTSDWWISGLTPYFACINHRYVITHEKPEVTLVHVKGNRNYHLNILCYMIFTILLFFILFLCASISSFLCNSQFSIFYFVFHWSRPMNIWQCYPLTTNMPFLTAIYFTIIPFYIPVEDWLMFIHCCWLSVHCPDSKQNAGV